MKITRTLATAVAAGSVLLASAPADAATTLPAGGANGADISYPQCGGTYSTDLAAAGFGIVGANGGRPMEANTCFGSEMAWEGSLAASSSPQVYVNTADPGNVVSDWPTSGSSPYGPCILQHGRKAPDNTACAYVYGEQEASYDLSLAGAAASTYQWWLDVETANSWQSRNKLEMNQASLDGMLAVLPAGQVGVYSTASNWAQIVGSKLDSVSTQAGLGALPQWIPTGSGSASVAASDCTSLPRFTSGPLVYTQYTSGYDYDHAC